MFFSNDPIFYYSLKVLNSYYNILTILGFNKNFLKTSVK